MLIPDWLCQRAILQPVSLRLIDVTVAQPQVITTQFPDMPLDCVGHTISLRPLC